MSLRLALFAAAGLTLVPSEALSQPVPLDPADLQLNSFTTCWQWVPSVASTAHGGFVVVFKTCEAFGIPGTSIAARRFDADTGPLDPVEFQVNTYTGFNLLYRTPDVASDAAGNFVVVWQSRGSAGTDQDEFSIQARRFAADGTPLDAAEIQVNTFTTNDQQRPSVAMSPGGDFVVVWDSWGAVGEPSSYSVQARRFRADGTPLDESEFTVNAYSTWTQFQATVAMDARGGFVVSFFSDQDRSVRARRFAADGTPLDPAEFQVNTATGTLAVWYPTVAGAPGGEFVVAWQRGFWEEIRARPFAADGTPLTTTDLLVNTETGGGPRYPSVGMDAEGGFVVVWESFRPNLVFDIRGRRYRPDGTPFDAAEFQVNSNTNGHQRIASVARAAVGDFVVVWQSATSLGNDTDAWSIQGRRFGRPTIPVTSTSGGTGGPGCTLRDAVAAASGDLSTGECAPGNGGGVVELPAGATIALSEADNGVNALPVVEGSVTVRGRGGRIERDPGLACPVGPEMRLFEVAEGGVLALEDVAVSNGCLSTDAGAGVLVSGGTLVLEEASIEGNETASSGGGVALDGGSLIALDSSIRGNLAGAEGGGFSATGSFDWLFVDRSTISGNAAATGGGLAVGGQGPASLRHATVSGNVASLSGGGLAVGGAASRLGLDFVTLTWNEAPAGSGAFVEEGVLTLHGSLLGENLGGADCAAGAGTLSATGANLDTDGSCAALAGGGVASVPALGLGPPADNGGATPTHLPLAGSPALDAAPACATAAGAAVVVDQRGYPRPTDDDGDSVPECDLGAVERGTIFRDGFGSGDVRRWSASAG